MDAMQAEQAESVTVIAQKYAEIEEDTAARITRFVEELKRRKELMKSAYRKQLVECHTELKSYKDVTKELQSKNTDLIVTNCELLKTVDALEQIKVSLPYPRPRFTKAISISIP